VRTRTYVRHARETGYTPKRMTKPQIIIHGREDVHGRLGGRLSQITNFESALVARAAFAGVGVQAQLSKSRPTVRRTASDWASLPREVDKFLNIGAGDHPATRISASDRSAATKIAAAYRKTFGAEPLVCEHDTSGLADAVGDGVSIVFAEQAAELTGWPTGRADFLGDVAKIMVHSS